MKILKTSQTFERALNPTVANIPKQNITMWGTYFRLNPCLFFNKETNLFIFCSEYGGYLALQCKYKNSEGIIQNTCKKRQINLYVKIIKF